MVGPAAVKNAMPVPPLAVGRIPVTPVVNGRPVRLVATPEAGVPRAGATSACPLGRVTVPVNVGEARGAFSVSNSSIAACTVVAAIPPAGVFTILDAGCLCPGSAEDALFTR